MGSEDDMGLEKSIKSGKEHREEYRNGKRYSKHCRNHGGCLYCEGNIYLSGYSPMLLKYLEVGFDGEAFLNKLLKEYKKTLTK